MPPSLAITSWSLAGIIGQHQVVQELHLLRPLGPDLENGSLPLLNLLRGDTDVLSCFLILAKKTPALQSSTAALLESFPTFFRGCVC